MPRRLKPDPLALAVGARIRQLRQDAGLTLEKLAYESKLGSKGHLSNLEKGLVRPTINTLKALADRLDVLLLDLVTFPAASDREALIDRTREAPRATLRMLLDAIAPRRRAKRRKRSKQRIPTRYSPRVRRTRAP